MKKIAVIGAGVFGLETASQLAAAGNEVSIFEQKSEILSEATANSIMRLHLGLHYPRDLETAIQSQKGYQQFLKKYPKCINLNFNNYYALSGDQSKISETDFLDFVAKSGISTESIPIENLSSIGLNTNKITNAWVCKEGVIDILKLRHYYSSQPKLMKKLYLNTEIIRAEKMINFWQLTDNRNNLYNFDFIVRATYGLDRISSSNTSIQNRNFEYHRTLILELELNKPIFGLTVIDGDFITVLPKGFGKTFLLYAPKPSVLERFIGGEYPKQWDQNGYFNYHSAQKKLIERLNDWFPEITEVIVLNNFSTIRSIQPNVSKTDQRVSRLESKADGFIDIWSGKIDHCIEIGAQVVDLIDEFNR